MKAIISLVLVVLAIISSSRLAYTQGQSKDRAKVVEEDARKEGKVVVYVSSKASDAKALKAAFEKKYPFINMELFSTGKDALLTKYLLEARTDHNIILVKGRVVFAGTGSELKAQAELFQQYLGI